MNKVNVMMGAAGQPSTTVIVSQGQPRTDFTFPEGKAPGILMLIVSLLHLGFFLEFAILYYAMNVDVIVSFVFYFITGVLATVGAFKKQKTGGVATGCIVMSVFCLLNVFSQMVWRTLGIFSGSFLIAMNQRFKGEVILWSNVVLLVVTFLAFALSIALIVIPSKVVCSCCQPQQPGTVIVQQGMARGNVGRLA